MLNPKSFKIPDKLKALLNLQSLLPAEGEKRPSPKIVAPPRQASRCVLSRVLLSYGAM